ncbi:MAG: sulfatase-like hydrolase/transferase [Acidobacteriota bacterium]
MPLTRRDLLAAAPFVHTPGRAATPRPNVVMFMTDDHGAWATGAYGCKEIHTPNIDRLAAAGARFTRAFAATPVCSPSRVTYLTGAIPSRHGVQDWLRPVDSFGPKSHRWYQGLTAYSEILAQNGYTLGMCGKWHMGEDDTAQAGFTYWASVPGGGGTYKNPEFVKNGRRTRVSPFKTDGVTDCALEFLDQQKKDRPFYLLAPYYAPHTPYDFQPEEYRKWYNNAAFSCFPTTPMHPWQNKGLAVHHGNRASMHAYCALITGVDYNVGRILKRLEELGVRENTLVVFTADQGWNAGHHGVWGKGNGTVPLNMYEESIRVPMIWSHPGKIKAGLTPSAMVSAYDYFPTILDYLGLTAPPDARRVGRSYAAFLRGQNPRWENRLYFEYCYVRAIRTENLKYVERIAEWPSELYDLEADPGETRNVIDDPAQRKNLDTLRADMHRFFERAGAPPLEEWRSTTTQEITPYERAK